MQQTNKQRVWKLVISGTSEPGTIEKILDKACAEIMKKGAAEGPFALVERIDLRKKDNETVVFLRANQETISEFQNTIQLQKLQLKGDIVEISRDDIVRA